MQAVDRLDRAWSKEFLDPTQDTAGRDIAVDSDGSVYVAATQPFRYLLLKYSPEGVLLWTREVETLSVAIVADRPAHVLIDSNHHAVLAGTIKLDDHEHMQDYFVAKYSPSGDQEWLRTFDNKGDNDSLADLTSDDLDNLYLVGACNQSGPRDVVTVKYSSEGVLAWVARYVPRDDLACSIRVSGEGLVYVLASTTDFGTDDDIILIQYSPGGVEQWVRRYNGGGESGWTDDWPSDLALDVAGNAYLVGYSEVSEPNGAYGIVTIKYSQAGEQLWVKRYDRDPCCGGGDGGGPAGIVVDGQNNIYVGGMNPLKWAGRDLVVIKYAPSGEETWQKRFDLGDNGEDNFRALGVASDGHIMVTGVSDALPGYSTLELSPEGILLRRDRFDWRGMYQAPAAIGLSAAGDVYVTGRSDRIGERYRASTVKYTRAERRLYFPQIGDGEVGPIRFQTELALVNTGAGTTAEIEFFSGEGAPMVMNLGALGTASSFILELDPGKPVVLETPGEGQLKVGYARVTGAGRISGTAVFTMSNSGVIQYQAGVPEAPPLTDFSLFFSADEARNTGLAIVNTGTGPANPVFRLYDSSSNLVATRALADMADGSGQEEFGPGCHLARYVTEIFPGVAGVDVMQGTLTIAGDEPLAAVTLLQRDDPELNFPADVTSMTAFPVVPGRRELDAGPVGRQISYFPQIGNGVNAGIEIRTGLVLLNTGSDTEAKIRFLGRNGLGMAVNLGGFGTGDTFQIPLAQGSAVVLETNGQGALSGGYALLEATTGVGGTAVFSVKENGVPLFHAGVAQSPAMEDFSILMSRRGDAEETGIAVANAAGNWETAAVTLRLFDSEHNLLATKEINLAMFQQNQVAAYSAELFPEINNLGLQQGLIEVTSDQPLAPVTLRQHRKPGMAFPEDVYLLTTFPVAVGCAP